MRLTQDNPTPLPFIADANKPSQLYGMYNNRIEKKRNTEIFNKEMRESTKVIRLDKLLPKSENLMHSRINSKRLNMIHIQD